MRPLVLLVPILLSALELPPPALEVHPDGARVVWNLPLPAGRHRLDLPAWSGGNLAVRGADAWLRVAEPGQPPPLPAAVAALLAERNRLAGQAVVLAAARAALGAADRQWRTTVAALAASGGDPAAWQAGLDAVIGERVRLDGEDLQAAEAARALAERAANAGGAPALRAISGSRPLTAAGLALAWSAAVGAGSQRAHLDVQLAVAGTLRIEELRSDCRWRSTCDLRLVGGQARLARRAVVEKPEAFAPGRVAVLVSASPLAPRLTLPVLPTVALVAQPVEASLRGLVGSGQRTVAWEATRSADAAATASTVAGDSASFAAIASIDATVDTMAEHRQAVLDVDGGAEPTPASATFALGELELTAGTGTVVAAIGESPLVVLADEWAVFPQDRPAALRRVTVQVDGRPLPPGRLRVLAEGQLPIEDETPWVPGGGTLTVCAGIDERIVVVSSTPWLARPGDDRRKRRREGLDTWIANATGAPVTVAVYRTMPVSTVEEVTVESDPDTTPGATAVVPGLLRWQLALPVGTPTRVGLGWTLKAGGSFSFE